MRTSCCSTAAATASGTAAGRRETQKPATAAAGHLARDSSDAGGGDFQRTRVFSWPRPAVQWYHRKDFFRQAGFDVVYASVSAHADGSSKAAAPCRSSRPRPATKPPDLNGAALRGAAIAVREDRQERRRRGRGEAPRRGARRVQRPAAAPSTSSAASCPGSAPKTGRCPPRCWPSSPTATTRDADYAAAGRDPRRRPRILRAADRRPNRARRRTRCRRAARAAHGDGQGRKRRGRRGRARWRRLLLDAPPRARHSTLRHRPRRYSRKTRRLARRARGALPPPPRTAPPAALRVPELTPVPRGLRVGGTAAADDGGSGRRRGLCHENVGVARPACGPQVASPAAARSCACRRAPPASLGVGRLG